MANTITFGQVGRWISLGDLIVTETVHAPHLKLRPHDHGNANLNVVLRGDFTESVERQRFACRRASVLFKPEGARHANEYSATGAHCLAIELPARLRTLLADQPRHVVAPHAVVLASHILDEMSTPAGPARDLVVEGLVYELVGNVCRAGDGNARWSNDVVDVIEELLPTKFMLSDVAAAVGRSPAHTARTFRRVHGMSIGEYIRRCRIARAMRQLRDTDLAISHIAADAGFADQSHFTNVFRRVSGTTPRVYRDRARSRSSR